MTQISLDDIRLFVAVVQAGSLSQASELTGISISRLSRHLTQLEQAFGTQLLNRSKNGVHPNELGEHFFAQAQIMLHHAQIAIESVHHSLEKPSGLLRISAPIDLSNYVLAPHLHEYLRTHPHVSIDVNLTQQKINMIQDGIDIAIRAGALENDNVVAKTLFHMNFGIFAHADYLQQYGTPHTPYDLYQHKIIGQTLTFPWRFTDGNQSIHISPQSYIGCNDFLLLAHMIEQGMGIGLMPILMSQPYPNWVQILTDFPLPTSPISLIYYKNRGSVPTVRSFVDWLMTKCCHYP